MTDSSASVRTRQYSLRASSVALLWGICASVTLIPAARSEERPAYKSSRSDEDWTALRDPSKRADPLDALKWIPLNGDGSWYVTIGGELRERYEYSRNPVFGLGAPARNDYLLQRAYLFADVHYGPYLRTFTELASGLIAGEAAEPSPTQKDELDILQGFGEVTLPLSQGKFSVRAGRQEMSFGSSRLVSVRESPNIRRSFDGVRVSWSGPDSERIDAFVTRPVAPQTGIFNDSNDPNQAFWGLYATANVPGIADLKADLYYFGLERKNARFAQGTADEQRQTIGTRFFGKHDAFDWNIEAAYQFGTFGTDNISAWTVSSDIGYTFEDVLFSPRLGLNADVISGDHDLHDQRLGTFNPLFPKLPYFSEANLAAPANLIDIQPNVTLQLSPKLELNIGWNPLWKEAEADSFYVPPLNPAKGTSGGTGRFIGQQITATVGWQVSDHLNLNGTYVHFSPGQRIKDAGGRSGDFVSASAQWLF
ncbi:hypothetical protein CU103_21075 [Phyllobacterium sophorae]|uniref:Alginate export domain-containing protein n=1 Tax=Phyllobacterium sophorae TaxID=1520277 RepID=A0A2P7B5U1_9HYPH|nr:hypothetical protein CU103_21075 [Phyllobacterium sophorae]